MSSSGNALPGIIAGKAITTRFLSCVSVSSDGGFRHPERHVGWRCQGCPAMPDRYFYQCIYNLRHPRERHIRALCSESYFLYDSIAFIALKSTDKRTVPYIFRVSLSCHGGVVWGQASLLGVSKEPS